MVGQKIKKLREVARIAGDGVRAQTVFDGQTLQPHVALLLQIRRRVELDCV